MKKIDKWIIYSFCILNSISGLQISGIAINSVIVGIFMIFIIVIYIRTSVGIIKIKRNDYYFYYLLSAIISCILSSMYVYVLPHVHIVRGFLINCIMYILMYILLVNLRTDVRESFSETFVLGLIYAARVQVIWGIAQIVLLYSSGININQILFVDILHSSNSRDWIMGFYTGNSWNMRITGLNFENSMFALVVCVGLALEKNTVWKLLLIGTLALSLSRTGWFILIGYLVITLYKKIKAIPKGVSAEKIIKRVTVGVIVFLAVFIIYKSNMAIQRQVDNIFLRINDNDAVNVSGARHYLYYPYGIYLWATDANFLQKIFGYGMRVSGIAFSQNENIKSIVGIRENFSAAWNVECDVVGLLLGGGILVFVLYYTNVIKIIKFKDNPYRDAILVILLGGITYHYHTISYVMFVFMFANMYLNGIRTSINTNKRINLY